MKKSIQTGLSIFFIAGITFFTACSPKQAIAETAAPQESGSLEKLGFHVFPQPLALPAFTVPGIAGTTTAGTTLKSEDLAGSITLLNFWATWCPPCKKEMPSIQRLYNLMAGTKFRIVAISTGETRKTVEDFIAKNKYTYPVYLDEKGSLGASFASQGIPTTYILDKSGKIFAGIVGSREYDESSLVTILKEMAAK